MGAMVIVKGRCAECGAEHTIEVRVEDYVRWHSPNRPLVQDCFPYLTASDRELFFLPTHICGECFDRLVGNGE